MFLDGQEPLYNSIKADSELRKILTQKKYISFGVPKRPFRVLKRPISQAETDRLGTPNDMFYNLTDYETVRESD